MSNSERHDDPDRQRASTRPQARLSPVWIVPLVALLIGAWLVYDTYRSRGPQITLTMSTAEGIEAGSTLIKTRNVEVGRVERVTLAEDQSHARLTARMSPGTDDMLVEDSRFWVVKPRIGREGISGLNTVLSGAFIQLEPGDSDIQARAFEVNEQPPVAPAGAQGLRINLVSQLGNSLRVGDPVTYQGFTVGRVEEASFEPGTRRMRHRVFIESPYDSLVTEGTRFWSARGIDLHLDSEGVRVRVESFETLVGGGVTFGVPDDLPPGSPVEADATFTLYSDEDSARQGSFSRYLEYVLLVDDTVRGLSRGAPVEFRGVRIGTVAAVPWNFTAPQADSREGFAIPVLIRIEPQRLGIERSELEMEEWRLRFDRFFDLGLRASLKSGNLLTGALFVDLKFQRDLAGQHEPRSFAERRVFPTTTGGFAQLEEQVTELLSKLNSLEVEPVLAGLERNLAASESLLGEGRELSATLRSLLEDPATRELPANLSTTLAEMREAMAAVSPQSPAYRQLSRTVGQLELLLRELQPLARTLSEDPRALLFDSLQTEDPVPRAPRPDQGGVRE